MLTLNLRVRVIKKAKPYICPLNYNLFIKQHSIKFKSDRVQLLPIYKMILALFPFFCIAGGMHWCLNILWLVFVEKPFIKY